LQGRTHTQTLSQGGIEEHIMRLVASFMLIATVAGVLAAGDEGLAGTWKLSILEDGQLATLWLVRLESKAGKWSAETEGLKGVPPGVVSDVQVRNDLIQFQLRVGKEAIFQFEGKVPRAGAKKALGSITREGRSIPAFLESTAAKNAFELDRELLMRTPNDPRVFAAALDLIAGAKENKATVKDVQEWLDTALRTAESYGPRFQADYTLKLLETISAQKDYASVAASVALKAEKMLDPKASPLTQVRFLTTIGAALESRLEKLEEPAYAEYSKDALGYKPAKFAGRKAKSERVVLVELFTGTMCPPCVAADLAFEGLEQTFSAKDVVLLQYHLHVPGPDPLTNNDAEKRGEYYGRTLRGTPMVYFNGKPDKNVEGGGGREDAEDKYKEYRTAVETLLEKPGAISLQSGATRQGDKIQITATVKDLDKPGETMRLRFALVEDWVRYKARNGTQYHHRVVRALPGGPAGAALTKKDFEHAVTVDLNEVRAGLTKYLDEFVKNEGPFPDAQRPMRLRDLHVVAFVQNDDTYEVLQAVDVPVK
jgi:hypothetical protein